MTDEYDMAIEWLMYCDDPESAEERIAIKIESGIDELDAILQTWRESIVRHHQGQ